jgi:hypothetical protein
VYTEKIKKKMILKLIIYGYLIETRIMAKIRYFPRSGTTSDVGGIISTTNKKNTYKLVRIEMDRVT